MADLEQALRVWREVVGEEHVLTGETALSAAQTATFETAQSVPAIIRPGSREEVQGCVRVANEHRVPIYPVSTGKNWGYGSRVPPRNGYTLMELHRMDRILDFDEDLAYVTVEPGVTLRRLYEFLKEKDSGLMVSVTGSTPDSGLIGNALERGLGSGPYYERAAHVCGFEVVLPTGEFVRTGFSRFEGAKTAKLHRWGVGPYVDGLFAQSNLGIVTEMTLWLAPRPAYFQSCYFGLDDEGGVGELVEALRPLHLQGLFRAGLTLRNDFNFFSRIQQYPWEALDGQTPMPEEFLERIRKMFFRNAPWGSRWMGWAELYGASREEGLAVRSVIERALADKVDRLAFMDEGGAAVVRWDEVGKEEALSSGYLTPEGGEEEFAPGVPDETNLRSVYWRKKSPIPEEMDPDRDGCGAIFCVPTVPYAGEHVLAAIETMKATLAEYGFEPVLLVGCPSPRAAYVDAVITYDREEPGEDERALACHDAMMGRMIEAGYIPARLATPTAKLLPEDGAAPLVEKLKAALDPNGILAPGRYGIG